MPLGDLISGPRATETLWLRVRDKASQQTSLTIDRDDERPLMPNWPPSPHRRKALLDVMA
jgi:hypothetical protein